MKFTAFSIKHLITTLMIFLALFLIGLVSLSKIGLELFPDITYPTVMVYCLTPGSGPEEVEERITKYIEDAIYTLNGVEQISSVSSEGISVVIINFTWGTNMDTIVYEVREKLNTIEDDLPDTAEIPRIVRFNPEQLPCIVYNVTTRTEGMDIRLLVEEKIVPELEKIEGVARVGIFGGKIQAVTCKMDLDTISKLNIPIIQILKVFQGENVNLPAGSISLEDKYIVMRALAEFETIYDLENVLIDYRENVPIYLKDIAEIALDYLPQEEILRTGTFKGVQISVNKQPGHNTVDVNDRIKTKMEELKSVMPPSVIMEIGSDQSKSINESIGSLGNAAWQGGLLAILILLLFLRNFRSTFIISITIPISVVATFSIMNFAGISMNILSLLGITLGIGMFVDNAIVVLESIYRKQLSGHNPVEAANIGTDEVARAITASTLTTVSVFVPLLFLEGIAGLLFRDLAYTISFALLISLLMAISLIPVLCSRFLKLSSRAKIISKYKNIEGLEDVSLADVEIKTGRKKIDNILNKIQKALQKLDRFYEKALTWALDHSYLIIISAVVLLVLSISSILLLGMEFIPEADEAKFSISVETKMRSTYEMTEKKVIEIEKIIYGIVGDDLEALSSKIGSGGSLTAISDTGSHLANISIRLVDKDQRDRSIWEIVREVNFEIKQKVTDVEITTKIEGMSSLANQAQGGSSAISIELSSERLEDMYQYAKEIAGKMETVTGCRDVEISYKEGKPELQLRVKRKEAVSLGLTPLEITLTLRTAYKGTTVTLFQTEEKNYDVVVMLKDEDRNSEERIKNLFFINPEGNKIPLENVVEIVEEEGPLSIERKNRVRTIKITGELSGETPLSQVMDSIRREIAGLGPVPPGIEISFAGSEEQMNESFQGMFFTLLLAAALVYMVMASQFESLLHPFIVMFSVPFAVIGLVFALLLTNTTFSLVAFMGGILLVGIVVNNAIVLIDYMNTLQKRGLSLKEAIILGGKTRLKPILMTTFTTIFGLLPTALGIGMGAELRSPIGIAVVGGLSTSTLITLILIPTIYFLIESKIKKKT
jgi:HAE1 family hydrophobic/amphiphilic exporter-1